MFFFTWSLQFRNMFWNRIVLLAWTSVPYRTGGMPERGKARHDGKLFPRILQPSISTFVQKCELDEYWIFLFLSFLNQYPYQIVAFVFERITKANDSNPSGLCFIGTFCAIADRMSSVIGARGKNDHQGKFEETTFISFQYATDDVLSPSSPPYLRDTLIQFGSNAAGTPMIPLPMD